MRVQGYRRGALRSFVLHLLVFSAFIGIFLSPFHAEGADTATLIVKLHDTLSVEEQAQLFTRDGGEKTSSVPALRLHIVRVPAADLPLILQNYQNDPQVASVEVGKSRRAEGFSNDAEVGVQWALGKIGWDQLFGSVTPAGTARIALLDTGVNANHPDLSGAILPGASMLVSGENGLTDPNGHGTALAGIIAAAADNNLGVAGVAYQAVSVIPVTVLDASGIGQDSDIVAGIVWAADNGADVILMGFSNDGFSQSLQDAIDYAWSKGAVLVAATGNGGLSTPTYPAGSRGVIGVSATDQGDLLAAGSNYGPSAFLAAPGASIFTTGLSGGYSDLNGTSASSAIVAAVAGFMKASDPSLSNGVIVGRLAKSADAAGAADDPEKQAKFGNGRVNMARAVADSSTEAIQPAGAAPPATGGPYVGPYLAAAKPYNIDIKVGEFTYGNAGGATVSVTVSPAVGSGNIDTTLSIGPLPAGFTSSFSSPALKGSGPLSYEFTLTPAPSVAAGTYGFAITATATGKDNNVTAEGRLTIAPRAVVITASNQTKAYGETLSFGSSQLFTATGLVNGDTIVSVDLGCQGGRSTAPPGAYPITGSNATGTFNPQNYSIAYQEGTLIVVGKTQATVTLSNLTQTYTGQALTPTVTTDPPNLNITWTNAPQTEAGTYEVTATVDDPNYTGSATDTFTIDPAPQTITFDKPHDQQYGAIPFNLSARATSSQPVSFQSTTPTVCTVSGDEVTILRVGTCTIEATQPGNANFKAATPVQQSFTVTAGALDRFAVTVDDTDKIAVKPFTVTVTALDAGGNIIQGFSGTASLTTTAGAISPSLTGIFLNGSWSGPVTVTGAGSGRTVTATKSGGIETGTTSGFNVVKASQSIVMGTLGAKTFGDPAFVVTAQGGGSVNPIAFTAGPATVCTISGATVTSATVAIMGAGNCTVTASQAGNDTYEAATDVLRPFTVNKATPTITFAAIPNKTTSDLPFALSATSSSGQTVRFERLSGPATLSGNMVTITGAGTIELHAYELESANYKAANAYRSVVVTAAVTKCAAPGRLTVPAASTGAVFIYWTASNTPNVTYVVDQKAEGDTSWTERVYTGTLPQANILVPAQGGYTFQVKAIRSDLAESTYATSATVCNVNLGAPRNLTVPTTSTGLIYIYWTASPTAGASYIVEQNFDNKGWVQLSATTKTDLSVPVNASGSYAFRVKARIKDLFDDSGYTDIKTCTVAIGAPRNLVVPAISYGSIFISWDASPTAGAEYVVGKSRDGGAWEWVQTGPGTYRTFVIDAPGQYRFQVKAFKTGFGESAPITTATTCNVTLGAPSNLVVPATSTGALFIQWKESATPGAGYVLETKRSDGSNWEEVYSGYSTNATVIINTSGSYSFRVRATRAGFDPSGDATSPTVCKVTLP